MKRSFIPFILAILGSTMIAWAINMPLFEWEVSEEIVTDPPHEVRFNSSPWIAKFGDSLEDSSLIFDQFDGSYCGNSFSPEKLNSVVNRSWGEKTLEQITRNINRNIIPWLWLLIFLCGVYIWWYALQHKRPITEALIFTVVGVILLCIVVDVSRPFFAHVVGTGCIEGTITFNAQLSKIHYETLMIFIGGTLLDIGALSIMLCSIVLAVMARKKLPG